MMTTLYDLDPVEFAEWLEMRPQIIQELVKEFPWGARYTFNNGVLFVVGWDENNKVMMSEINPRESKEAKKAAERNRFLLDVDWLRSVKVTVQ